MFNSTRSMTYGFSIPSNWLFCSVSFIVGFSADQATLDVDTPQGSRMDPGLDHLNPGYAQ